MSNQTPTVGIGTQFPAGTVVAIMKDHVLIETAQGRKPFTFTQIEEFINDERSLSEA